VIDMGDNRKIADMTSFHGVFNDSAEIGVRELNH
jgi:hypothetical protein